MNKLEGKTLKEVCDMMYPKQLEAFLECLNGTEDVIITGSGGSGKSFIIDALHIFAKKSTVFTGTTGTASVNIGGATTHSVLSLPLGMPTKQDMAKVSRKFRSLFTRNHKVKRIVIDEASMLGVQNMDAVLKRQTRIARSSNSKKVRLLMFGDWTQLLNVTKKGQEQDLIMKEYGTTTLLDSELFQKRNIKVIELDETKRTSDPELKLNLERVRFGKELDIALPYFNHQVGVHKAGVTYIATTNAKADQINREAFNKNPNPAFYYGAEIEGLFKANDTLMKEQLVLKDGLRVMAISNEQEGNFVNGSCGEVTGCLSGAVMVKFDNGIEMLVEPIRQANREYYTDIEGDLCSRETASFTQIPLKQCDAVTVHKAQGMSLDEATLDVGDWVFAEGITYTGLSRMTNLKGLTLTRKLKPSDVKVNIYVRNFYNALHGIFPKVRILVYCSMQEDTYTKLTQQWLDFLLQNYTKEEVELVPFCPKGTAYAREKGIVIKRTREGITHALVLGNDSAQGFNDAVKFTKINNIRTKTVHIDQ